MDMYVVCVTLSVSLIITMINGHFYFAAVIFSDFCTHTQNVWWNIFGDVKMVDRLSHTNLIGFVFFCICVGVDYFEFNAPISAPISHRLFATEKLCGHIWPGASTHPLSPLHIHRDIVYGRHSLSKSKSKYSQCSFIFEICEKYFRECVECLPVCVCVCFSI